MTLPIKIKGVRYRLVGQTFAGDLYITEDEICFNSVTDKSQWRIESAALTIELVLSIFILVTGPFFRSAAENLKSVWDMARDGTKAARTIRQARKKEKEMAGAATDQVIHDEIRLLKKSSAPSDPGLPKLISLPRSQVRGIRIRLKSIVIKTRYDSLIFSMKPGDRRRIANALTAGGYLSS